MVKESFETFILINKITPIPLDFKTIKTGTTQTQTIPFIPFNTWA